MLQAASFNQIISLSLIFQMLGYFTTWKYLVIFIDELWMAVGKLLMGKCSDNVAIDFFYYGGVGSSISWKNKNIQCENQSRTS